jgi:hypothetical protein
MTVHTKEKNKETNIFKRTEHINLHNFAQPTSYHNEATTDCPGEN